MTNVPQSAAPRVTVEHAGVVEGRLLLAVSAAAGVPRIVGGEALVEDSGAAERLAVRSVALMGGSTPGEFTLVCDPVGDDPALLVGRTFTVQPTAAARASGRPLRAAG